MFYVCFMFYLSVFVLCLLFILMYFDGLVLYTWSLSASLPYFSFISVLGVFY